MLLGLIDVTSATLQDTKVVVKTTRRTGVIISGIPFSVNFKRYVTVRWDDDNTCSNVLLASIAKRGQLS